MRGQLRGVFTEGYIDCFGDFQALTGQTPRRFCGYRGGYMRRWGRIMGLLLTVSLVVNIGGGAAGVGGTGPSFVETICEVSGEYLDRDTVGER